jgi:type I restriction enzyme R subunit
MTTDISEKSLETLIVEHMTGSDGLFSDEISDLTREAALERASEGAGWIAARANDFDRTHAIDPVQLFSFLLETQPNELKKLGISDYKDIKNVVRLKFLTRLRRSN